MAAGFAVAVVSSVVERFMAKILGRTSQRYDSDVVREVRALVNPLIEDSFGSGGGRVDLLLICLESSGM